MTEHKIHITKGSAKNGTGGGYDEQLSVIRLLADEYDINFYICQLYLLKGKSQ